MARITQLLKLVSSLNERELYLSHQLLTISQPHLSQPQCPGHVCLNHMPSPGHPVCQGLTLLQALLTATSPASPWLLSSCTHQAASHLQIMAFSCPQDKSRELKPSQTPRQGCHAPCTGTGPGAHPWPLCLGPDLCHIQHSVPGLGQTRLTLHHSSCLKLFPPHFIALSHCTLPFMPQYKAFSCPFPGRFGSLQLPTAEALLPEVSEGDVFGEESSWRLPQSLIQGPLWPGLGA